MNRTKEVNHSGTTGLTISKLKTKIKTPPKSSHKQVFHHPHRVKSNVIIVLIPPTRITTGPTGTPVDAAGGAGRPVAVAAVADATGAGGFEAGGGGMEPALVAATSATALVAAPAEETARAAVDAQVLDHGYEEHDRHRHQDERPHDDHRYPVSPL